MFCWTLYHCNTHIDTLFPLANRHVGETDYNTRSSRSHTIFQMVNIHPLALFWHVTLIRLLSLQVIESRNKNAYVPDQGSVRISQLVCLSFSAPLSLFQHVLFPQCSFPMALLELD